MKHIQFLHLCLGLLLFVPTTFAQDVAPETQTQPVSAPLSLQLKPQIGSFYVMRLSARQEVEVGADPTGKSKDAGQKMLQNVSYDFNWKPLEILPNGDSLWKFWVIGSRFERIAPNQPAIRYDSSRPPKKVPEQAELFHFMLNTGLTFQLNTRGEIVGVRETEKMADVIWRKMGLKNSGDQEMMKGMLKRELGGNAFRNMGIVFATFAANAVNIGESWTKIDPVASDWGLIYTGPCTVQSRDGETVTIGREAKTAPDPKELKKPAAERQLLPITGTQSGTFSVDAATGRTRRALLTQEFQARLDDTGFVVGDKGRPFLMRMTLQLDTLVAK